MTGNENGRRAAVIGSGFGGLGAAIRLQAMGMQTVLYEARDLPGGRAYVYQDKGFTFDAGPTVVTAPHTLEELYQLSGRRLDEHVELLPITPLYRLIWSDGDRFDYVQDMDQMRAQIAARNPDDVQGYERFLEFSKAVFDKGYTELAAEPFLRFRDMLRVAPQLMKLRADRNVYSTVAKYIKDDHLRQALTFHTLLVGGNPYQTSSIYALIHYLEKKWGVTFPRGGTHALVRALVDLFEKMGGEIRLSTPVESAQLVEAKGVTRHRIQAGDGSIEDYDCVVSNADLHHTYGSIYASGPRAVKTAKKLEKMHWSMSLFVLYFGVDRTYDDAVAHHTILFGPRYKELLNEIFNGPVLADDFSLYLHSPSVTDDSLAPEGCSSFYVLSPVPHLGKADIDWDTVAPTYADRILEVLEGELPELRKHIVTKRYFTPKMFQDELSAYHGTAFSIAPRLTQSAYFRPHNRDPKIPGLYLVGAGTHPGAGIPGVLNSAKATAKLIAGDYGLNPTQESTS